MFFLVSMSASQNKKDFATDTPLIVFTALVVILIHNFKHLFIESVIKR